MELKAATYYVKETKAPKGFQLDKNVYTLTVKVGETAILKAVSYTHLDVYKRQAIISPQKGGRIMERKAFTVLSLREQPQLLKVAAQWFHSKWQIPCQAYEDSICLLYTSRCV